MGPVNPRTLPLIEDDVYGDLASESLANGGAIPEAATELFAKPLMPRWMYTCRQFRMARPNDIKVFPGLAREGRLPAKWTERHPEEEPCILSG